MCGGCCSCRPQDQADLAVSNDGTTAWVVLSYNDKPNDKHASLITRAMFVLAVSPVRAIVSTPLLCNGERGNDFVGLRSGTATPGRARP